MKKIFILIIVIVGLVSISQSQTLTDQNGDKVYRTNIAIFTNETFYTYSHGLFTETVTTDVQGLLKTSVGTLTTAIALNQGCRVVNRDQKVNDQIKQLLQENKMEDYLKGLSIQAKGEGADWILVTDISIFNRNPSVMDVSVDISHRMINVATNIAYSKQTTAEIHANSEEEFMAQLDDFLTKNETAIADLIHTATPVTFSVVDIKGKKVRFSANLPTGIRPGENINLFSYSYDTTIIQGKTIPLAILNDVATCSFVKIENGLVKTKANSSIKGYDPSTLFGTIIQNPPTTTDRPCATITYIDIPCERNSIDGYNKKLINQSVYSTITEFQEIKYIETALLPKVKEEREIQKGEEYLNGHTVKQMAAVGAQYYLYIDNVKTNPYAVSFTVNLIDVEKNTVEKSINLSCRKNDVHNAIYFAISQFFAIPAAVSKINGKKIVIHTPACLNYSIGEKFTLTSVKEVSTGISARVPICEKILENINGQESHYTIKKIFDKATLEKITDSTINCHILFESSFSEKDFQVDIEKIYKNEERKQKRASNKQKVSRALWGAVQSSTSVSPGYNIK